MDLKSSCVKNTINNRRILFNDKKSKAESKDNASDNNTDKNEKFEASQDWFKRFKVRANLHSIALKGEAASADITAAERRQC